jgi:hypothetical protein
MRLRSAALVEFEMDIASPIRPTSTICFGMKVFKNSLNKVCSHQMSR